MSEPELIRFLITSSFVSRANVKDGHSSCFALQLSSPDLPLKTASFIREVRTDDAELLLRWLRLCSILMMGDEACLAAGVCVLLRKSTSGALTMFKGNLLLTTPAEAIRGKTTVVTSRGIIVEHKWLFMYPGCELHELYRAAESWCSQTRSAMFMSNVSGHDHRGSCHGDPERTLTAMTHVLK